MKILLLSNMYPSDSHLFYGVFVKNFSDSMEREGAEIDRVVISGRGRSVFDKIKKYISYYFYAVRKIKQNNYDVIYVHSASLALIPVTLLRQVLKKPVVINIHGGDVMGTGIFSRIIFKANKQTIRSASLLVIPSQAFKETVEHKIKLPRTFVSPSGGVDRSVFFPTVSHERLEEKNITIGYISRIDEDKGWDTFIDSISIIKSSHPNIKITAKIIGMGCQVDEMLNKISSLGLDECFVYISQLPQKELPLVYQSFDVFIFPSRRLSESLGLVGLEAMSCGIPIIASKIGGITDYLNDGENGFFFQPGSSSDLANKILKFLSLPKSQIDDLSTKAAATAEKYDSVLTAKKLYSEIEGICGALI